MVKGKENLVERVLGVVGKVKRGAAIGILSIASVLGGAPTVDYVTGFVNRTATAMVAPSAAASTNQNKTYEPEAIRGIPRSESRASAAVYNFAKETPFSTIQSALSSYDNEVHLGEGVFEVPGNGTNFNVYAKVFQGAGMDKTILRATDTEHGELITVYGSNNNPINISDFKLTYAATGFVVSATDELGNQTKYHGISFERIDFDGLNNRAGVWQISPHDDPIDENNPSITISSSLVRNTAGFLHTKEGACTDRDQFIGLDQVTADNVQGQYLVGAFVIPSGETYTVRGQNNLTQIVLLNSPDLGLIKNNLWEYLGCCPKDIAQKEIGFPLTPDTCDKITEADNCFETTNLEFIPGTYVIRIRKSDPRIYSGPNNFIGAKVALDGDATLNGGVNGDDLAVMGGNWMKAVEGVTWMKGDFNGDLEVDGGDLALMGGDWMKSVNPAPGIPEPATFGLIALGALALLKKKKEILESKIAA